MQKFHLLTRYYLCNSCCDFCVTTSDRRSHELSWGALTLRALWRNTLTLSRDPQERSPWAEMARFEKSTRLLDVLHIVHLGALRDLAPAVIIDALDDGGLATFFTDWRGDRGTRSLASLATTLLCGPKTKIWLCTLEHSQWPWWPQALALADAGVGYSD